MSSPRLLQRGEERPRVALAEERAGMRDPEAIALVCSRPAKSSKSEPFAIVTTSPLGLRSRISSAIASETADDRVRRARDEPRDRVLALLLHAHGSRFRVAVRMRDDRVAQVGDPAACRSRA